MSQFGGPLATAPLRPRSRRAPTGNSALDASYAATDAQAEVAGEDFRRDVGERLGGLDAIGALRSGAAPVAVNEATEAYGRKVGQAAAGNAREPDTYLAKVELGEFAVTRLASASLPPADIAARRNQNRRRERARMVAV